jgi:hypothetical protein
MPLKSAVSNFGKPASLALVVVESLIPGIRYTDIKQFAVKVIEPVKNLLTHAALRSDLFCNLNTKCAFQIGLAHYT